MQGKHIEKITSDGLRYLLYLPPEYSREERLPLLLFLHGAGERGSNLELVKKHGPPHVVETRRDLPFILVSPQCPEGKYWQVHPLKYLIDEVLHETNADSSRLYCTGISMGGYGTWELAISYPDLFAAIIPICGGGNEDAVHKINHLPVWVFHGAKDYIVPVKASEAMVTALGKAGGCVWFTVYPEAAHDSWTETYNNDGIYEWLLHQKNLVLGNI